MADRDEQLKELLEQRRGPAVTKQEIRTLLMTHVRDGPQILRGVQFREVFEKNRVYVKALVDPIANPTPALLAKVVKQMEALLHEHAPFGIEFVCSARVAGPTRMGVYR